MTIDPKVRARMFHNIPLSLALYALPVLLMALSFSITGARPWLTYHYFPVKSSAWHSFNLIQFLHYIQPYQFYVTAVIIGAFEFAFGLYEDRWNKNERLLDIACLLLPKLIVTPAVGYFSLKLLPHVLPGWQNAFGWVPFAWACLIIAVADDLTQYWYHRLHHEIPWLWRFHRTHHSASYMGMAMASRQNIIYTIFFSQTYVIATLVYFGLGAPAIVVQSVKGIITALAHSSIPWDKPLYRHRILHPLAWVVERFISTPATHHAHHAASTDDGIGYYKGNFGNMFFLWDVIFGTAHISRQYPSEYGISHYEGDEWYAQIFWPILKSSVEGSELAKNGPIVRADIKPALPHQEAQLVDR